MTILNPPSTKLSRPLKRLTLLTAAVSFIGFIDAVYLTMQHFFELPLPCSLTQGCEKVLNSQYATIGPIPVALFGAIYYLFILVLAVHLFTSENTSTLPIRLILAATSFGMFVSLFLIYLQLYVIGAFCMYCLGSAFATILLFLFSLSLRRVSKSQSI